VALGCACALPASAVLAPPALADGDPASDVLASQSLFLPADGGFAQSDAARLNGVLTAARRAGVPIRVALIATPADLGSVTALWHKPQAYAQFLGQELSQVYRGTLVVAMPDGFGVTNLGERAGARSTRPSQAASAPLLPATIRIVQDLALAAGHRLPTISAAVPANSGSALGSVDLGSWLVLAAGAALIAVVWTMSLHARPPRRLRRSP
jgi:hypothetical protein